MLSVRAREKSARAHKCPHLSSHCWRKHERSLHPMLNTCDVFSRGFTVWPPTAHSLEEDKHVSESYKLKLWVSSQRCHSQEILTLHGVDVLTSSFTSILVQEVCHIMGPRVFSLMLMHLYECPYAHIHILVHIGFLVQKMCLFPLKCSQHLFKGCSVYACELPEVGTE